MVITSFGRKGYDEYGLEFIQTFLEHTDHFLTVYHEGIPADAPQDPRICYIDMTQENHFLGFARKLYDADPIYSGAILNNGRKTYNYRFDAFKFFRKVWALKHYDENRTDDDLIVWLDADITFTRNMPHDLFSGLLKDAYVAYIGRGGGLHSECGAMIFNPAHTEHHTFYELYWRIYETGAFRMLDEFNDCYVFDFARELLQPPEVNLGRGCDPVHPFIFTRLGLYMDHKKGPERKQMGHSPEAHTETTSREENVSNGGERQAKKSIDLMKKDHVGRYKWAVGILNDYPKQKEVDVPSRKPIVVDAACGVGYGSKLLSEVSDIVFSYDISQDALDYANDYYKSDNNVFFEHDLTSSDALERADVVVSFETIEHVPDALSLLSKFKESASILIGSVPNEDVVAFNPIKHIHHFRHYTKQELNDLLTQSGYKVLKWATQYGHSHDGAEENKADGRTLLFVAEAVQ